MKCIFDRTECEDCGLRIRNRATTTAVIACAPEGAGSSLKIRGSGGITYNVVLVGTTDPMASNARVQTSTGTMALRCLYSGCGLS